MSTAKTNPDRKRILVPLLVTVVALVVAVLAVIGPALSKDADEAPVAVETPDTTGDAEREAALAALAGLARRTTDDPMALGAQDAPVVLINYSEFQCPFCGKFARDTKPTLVERYVDEGLLRIEWRDFPYLGSESTTAAHAARAAAAQDGFWDFHDAMFADQQPPNSGKLTEDYLAGVAEQVGLDVDRFRADLADPDVHALAAEDFAEGQSIGVTGTPAFLVNGNPVIGAQPTETFIQVIDAELAKAG